MVVWQSERLTRVLRSVVVVPLTTNLDRAQLAGTAVIRGRESGPPRDSVALAFQMRAIRSRCSPHASARSMTRKWRSSSSPPTRRSAGAIRSLVDDDAAAERVAGLRCVDWAV